MSDDATKTIPWRAAKPDETPRGATTVANAARKAGWTVVVGFASGPWLKADDDEDDADEQIVQMVFVHGWRSGSWFRATWQCKLWTKAGEDGSYTFAGAQIFPPVKGEVIATKAKKDRHPEHLGAETLGGLKNSKTLNDYLKETV